jgi:hypothetical protein
VGENNRAILSLTQIRYRSHPRVKNHNYTRPCRVGYPIPIPELPSYVSAHWDGVTEKGKILKISFGWIYFSIFLKSKYEKIPYPESIRSADLEADMWIPLGNRKYQYRTLILFGRLGLEICRVVSKLEIGALF